MPRPRKELIIKPPKELTKKRTLRTEFKDFNKINNSTISEKEQLIRMHLTKLSRERSFLKEDNKKVQYLIELAKEQLTTNTNKYVEEKKNTKTNKRIEPAINSMELTLEKKKLQEVLGELRKFNVLKGEADEIRKIVENRSNELRKLREPLSNNSSYMLFLQKYKFRLELQKTLKNIEITPNRRNASKLNPAALERVILEEAEKLQLDFPKLKNINENSITSDIRKNLFIKDTRVKDIISINSKLNISNSEIITRTLNSVRLSLIEHMGQKRTQLSAENSKIQRQIMDTQLTYGKINITRLEHLDSLIKNLLQRFPTIDKQTTQGLEDRINQITEQLTPKKITLERYGNPQAQKIEPTHLDEYSRTRERAIILSKIERELNKIVGKYKL